MIVTAAGGCGRSYLDKRNYMGENGDSLDRSANWLWGGMTNVNVPLCKGMNSKGAYAKAPTMDMPAAPRST
jgi:hypothetical protein